MDTPSVRSVVADHSALSGMARGLRALVDGGACSCGATGCTGCLCREMEAFASRLKAHFGREEQCWSAVDAQTCDRTTLNWIDRLVGQHAELTKRLDVVCDRLAEARRRNASVGAALATEIRSLLVELGDHELSEARLSQRSVFEGWGHLD